MDFVSQEAAAAGRHAAEYVAAGEDKIFNEKKYVIVPKGGVRYTVPSSINPAKMDDEQVIRFRVGDVYKNRYTSVYVNGERIVHRKRPVMAPGEMEEVKLKKEQFMDCPEETEIIVTIEEA